MPAKAEHYEAVEQLLREYEDGLILYARQAAGMAAEDIVQDAFLKLLLSRCLPETPKAWLYRVVRNALIDRKRHERFCRTAPIGNWFESLPNTEIHVDFDGEMLTLALESLDPPVREIIVSKIWGELTFKEIAELTDRPISSVHHDYKQGIDRLRAFLGEREKDSWRTDHTVIVK